MATTYATNGTFFGTAGTSGQTSQALTTTSVGDLVVMFVQNASTTSPLVTGVSGGNCTGWTQLGTGVVGSHGVTTTLQTFYGIVSSTGAGTITLTYGGTVGTDLIRRFGQEFSSSAGAAGVWNVDTFGALNNTTSTTAIMPSLTPTAASPEVYFGAVCGGSVVTSGSGTGFTFGSDFSAAIGFGYDTAVTATVSPTYGLTSTAANVTMGALFYTSVAKPSAGFFEVFE